MYQSIDDGSNPSARPRRALRDTAARAGRAAIRTRFPASAAARRAGQRRRVHRRRASSARGMSPCLAVHDVSSSVAQGRPAPSRCARARDRPAASRGSAPTAHRSGPAAMRRSTAPRTRAVHASSTARPARRRHRRSAPRRNMPVARSDCSSRCASQRYDMFSSHIASLSLATFIVHLDSCAIRINDSSSKCVPIIPLLRTVNFFRSAVTEIHGCRTTHIACVQRAVIQSCRGPRFVARIAAMPATHRMACLHSPALRTVVIESRRYSAECKCDVRRKTDAGQKRL